MRAFNVAMTIKPAGLCPVPLLAVGLLAGVPGAGAAQLRPLEPARWDVVSGARWTFEVGAGVYGGQRASLAGTEGRLWELGAFTGAWSLGQVTLQVSGTAFRIFRDEDVFAEPLGGTRAPDGEDRRDAGDYRVSTLVRLTGGEGSFDALLRFGARLPTTDNRVGLGRDRTDFFSTLAGRYRRGDFFLAAESGIGILGTRDDHTEQVDPVLYALTVGHRIGPVVPTLTVLGQHDTREGSELRGTEDLSEIRLGVRTRGTRWARLVLVRGLTDFSPEWGLTLRLGISR